jgi:hypothetical protein
VSSAPLWLPLASAGIAVLGTLGGSLGGVLVTQRWADRREDKAQAREDEARTFEHRREAYTDFYEAVQAMARLAYLHGTKLPEDLPDHWYSEAFGKLSRLILYADRRVASAASEAYTAAWYWGMNLKRHQPGETVSEAAAEADLEEFNEGWGEYQVAERSLLVCMREALSIPEGDLMLPPPGLPASPDGWSPEVYYGPLPSDEPSSTPGETT